MRTPCAGRPTPRGERRTEGPNPGTDLADLATLDPVGLTRSSHKVRKARTPLTRQCLVPLDTTSTPPLSRRACAQPTPHASPGL